MSYGNDHVVLGAGVRSVVLDDRSRVLFVDVSEESGPHVVFNYYDTVDHGVFKYHSHFQMYYKKVQLISVYSVNDVLGKFSRSPFVAEIIGLFFFIDYLTKRNGVIKLMKFSDKKNGDVTVLIDGFLKKVDGFFKSRLFKPNPFVFVDKEENGEFFNIVLKKEVSERGEGRDVDRCKEYTKRTCVKRKTDNTCETYTRRHCIQ